jgi:hypothetical protein
MSLELNLQGLAAVAALAEARDLEKAAKAAASAAADAVRDLLGDNTVGTLAGVTVVEIKTVIRHDIDGKALKANEPELAAKYDKVIEYDKIVLA